MRKARKTTIEPKKFLIIGATGHVGSKTAVLLANRGCDVTALVRQNGATIKDAYAGTIKYITGDLTEEPALREAVAGMDIVISTANGVIPQKHSDNAKNVNEGGVRLVTICEEAGVKRFVQSSVPTYRNERNVPELHGKRLLEHKLAASPMQTVIIRNAAFMDVFIVMGGLKQAQDTSHHATTKLRLHKSMDGIGWEPCPKTRVNVCAGRRQSWDAPHFNP